MTRNHYASNEIKDKLVELTEQRNGMLHKWEERWEHLQLILEVYQFARDAAVAEAWLIAQDPYLKSDDLGVNIRLMFIYQTCKRIKSTDIQNNFMSEINMPEKFGILITQYHFVILIN